MLKKGKVTEIQDAPFGRMDFIFKTARRARAFNYPLDARVQLFIY